MHWVDRDDEVFTLTFEDRRFEGYLGGTFAPFGLNITIFNNASVSKETPPRPAISRIRLHDGAKHLVDVEVYRDAESYSIDLPNTPRSLRIELKLSSGAVLHKTVHISPKLKLKNTDDRMRFPPKGDPRTIIGKVYGGDKDIRVAILCLPRPEEGGVEQMEIWRLDPASTSGTKRESLIMRFVAKQPLTGLKATAKRLKTETASAAAAAGVKFKFTCRTQHRNYELINAIEVNTLRYPG